MYTVQISLKPELQQRGVGEAGASLKKLARQKTQPPFIDNEPDITEPTWLNYFHVYKKDAFIPGIKDGLAGPIISYWARLDNNRRWFAAPVLHQTK